jgi:cellulose synthase/poly-beta-1,6-N-acetylglucosamine synthase-like glycosyltransferase/exo-beta-1,3-glucanase (GH17 family)
MRTIAAVLALVLSLHAGLWSLLEGEASAPDISGPLTSVSYAPFGLGAGDDLGEAAREEKIRCDLEVLAPLARALRTYSSTAGGELVAGVAAERGLKVAVGAWVDKDTLRTEREITSVIELAKRHPNINGIYVGNETIFRGELGIDELVQLIRRVKRSTSLPVTTGEIWHVWLEHPELASAADYIAAHILPYWEGFSAAAAVDQAILIYNRLREAYPGKRIVIAEFGWPSAGQNLKAAVPGRLEQAEVIRAFAARAAAYEIDYNIVEAIDQPWKTFEGSVGAYWGLLDHSRRAKLSWSGPIFKSDHYKLAGLAVMLGLALSVPVLALPAATLGQAAFLAVAAHMAGAWLANVLAFWHGHYFMPGSAIAFLASVALLIPLILIVLARAEEIAAVALGRRPRRLVEPGRTAPVSGAQPKVSIHIPAYREPPAMLIRTLESVARLDYPSFECVVVINNTPDPALWRPVEECCIALGERFKLLNVDKLEGFKAGAMRVALEHTSPDAEIIGVLDADYVVRPDWLRDLVPHFNDPRVGLVQAPQDHRDGGRSPLHGAMNSEYAGFFDIGMVQRNEANAIVVHGTMCLIRRSALEQAGNWSSDTVCEDTDLGLTLIEEGWLIEYTRERYGAGLLPDTFEAFKKQRHRWAYGGVQIIRKHWARFLPGKSRLTRDQKREFALGWAGWLGAETLGVAVALFNLAMLPFILWLDAAVPDRILSVPVMASFGVSLLHFTALYRIRCRRSPAEMAGALIAAMSVQWTIANAVADGVVKDNLPFARTAKGGAKRRTVAFHALWETIIGLLLLAGAIVLSWFNINEVREISLFAGVLVLQSLPFLAAAGIALFEGSRFNDYAAWSALEAQLRGVPQDGALPTPVPEPAEAPRPAAE